MRLGPSLSQALSVRNHVHAVNQAPSRRLVDGALGLRIAGSLAGADWDLYGYTGPETGPNLGLAVDARCVRRAGTCRNLGRPDRPLVLRTDSRLEQRQSTMRMVGGDVALPVGPVTLRAEVAYLQDRHVLRSVRDVVSSFTTTLGRRPALVNAVLAGRTRRLPLAPLFPAEDAIDLGVGVDSVWRGWVPLLQLNQTILLDPAPARLVVADPETQLSGVVRRRFFAEQVEFELRGAWVFERDAWFLYPRIAFRPWDAVRLRIGYVAVGGDPVSMLGQYHANDELTLELRYSF